MIYKGKSLFELRYPAMESELVPVLQVCAVVDCMQQVAALVNAFDSEEISIDLLEQTALTEQYFEQNRPDILMINLDTVDFDYTSKILSMLESANLKPFLVAITDGTNQLSGFASNFSGAVTLKMPIYPPRDAHYLKQFFLSKVISKDYYMGKLRTVVNITLEAMHCPANTVGFACLEEAVLMVITDPLHYYSSSQEINKQLAESREVSLLNITSVVHNAVNKAFHEMSEAERGALFDEYGCDEPSEMEFIYAAAKLASIPAKKILHNMSFEPFTNPQRTFRYLQ